jgi:hypothetical protein
MMRNSRVRKEERLPRCVDRVGKVNTGYFGRTAKRAAISGSLTAIIGFVWKWAGAVLRVYTK